MRNYNNQTHLLSFSYHTGNGLEHGVFRVYVPRFLFPAAAGMSSREVCTLRDFSRFLSIADIADDSPEVTVFPFYYHLSRGIARLRDERDKIEPKSSKADKKIDKLTKSIATAVKLSQKLEKYGYPALTDGDPAVNVADWIRETRPCDTFVLWCTSKTATWSTMISIMSSFPDSRKQVASYLNLSDFYVRERDVISAIMAEAERRAAAAGAAGAAA